MRPVVSAAVVAALLVAAHASQPTAAPRQQDATAARVDFVEEGKTGRAAPCNPTMMR